MIDTIKAILSNQFLVNALIVGLFASIICGIIGTFVVIKKISFISGSIAHSVLGGIGIAYFLNFSPFVGALIFAILAALAIGFIKMKFRQQEDTVIGAFWAVGMAIGIIFMYLTPGYNVDLLTFLFGNLLLIGRNDILHLLILNSIVVLSVFFFFRQFLLICFDEEFARLRGMQVNFLYFYLLVLISISVVVLIQIVGLILVIALLTLPAAISAMFTRSPLMMMLDAFLISLFFILIGLFVSYGPNLPAGPVIIIIGAVSYFIAILLNKIRRK